SSQPSPQKQPPSGLSRAAIIGIWLAVAATFVALLVISSRTSTTVSPESLSYSTLLSQVVKNDVKTVSINQSSGVVTGTLTNGKTFTTQGPPGGMPSVDVQLMNAHHVGRNYVSTASSIWPTLITWGILIGLFVALWVWMGRRTRSQMAGIGNWSKSGAKVHTTERPSTMFADIAGYDGVKQEISEIVEFLKDPGRFQGIGARIPKGVLLVGPPGTGKTLVARATAGEAGVPFITITGSEFMEMFVGVGAARVRNLFETARSDRPSIIFIDEIDAIGRKRGTGLGGGHDEREQTLNQILAEMDGFDAAEGIIVMAATNRPDVLDPALLRAGRFDRQVLVPLPTLEERRAILEIHCRGKRMGVDIDLDVVARGTPGMSGADLENLVNEAALIAVRRGSEQIERTDLESAHDRVLLGLKRTSLVLTKEEKHIVAYHESGHALLAHLLPDADPVHKMTILPTGMALGVTQQLPDEDRQLQQRPYLNDALAVRLGGRAAEELVFGVASTGASDDLTSATDLAGRMVREWGMSDAIGMMAWGARGPVFLGEDLIHTREYSDETARLIDEEVARILGEQAELAAQTLRQHRIALDALASALEEKETLQGDEVAAIIDGAERTLVPLPAAGA
ncbi:MAG TPA: ATP-dependent zinc metalloprotease FtsH, partial [Acidimicrobiales bacterium]|nr:ATP-dependent zinc metalloprotease FtsH [Acidimicrobiales bacterium]